MKNTGVVTEIINGKAKIRFIKESACGGNCASCGGCGSKPIEIVIENPLSAEVYDKVEVESDSDKILYSAFVLYVVPILILIFAYLAAEKFFGEFTSVLLSVICFFLSFVGVKKYGNKLKIKIKMIRIIKE